MGEAVVALRKQTVSLCMIVRNEERNLSDCLQPVASLFDEIIIVDTGSQDGTRQIAARFTDCIFDFPWCDDFSAARNESLKQARGQWIFWLDADDRIRPEHAERLRDLFGRLSDQPQTYFMDTVLHGPYESEGPRLLSHPRLIHRHPSLHWRGRVHEQLQPDLTQLGYEVAWSDVRIDHLGYKDSALRQRKLQRDIRLLRMDYAVDPNEASTLLHLGLAYTELGNHGEARKHLRRLLADESCSWNCLERAYRALADMALRDGNPEDALRILDRGLSKFPQDEALLYSQANICFELGRYDAAALCLRQILAANERREHYAVASDLRRKLAPRKLADVFRMQQRYDQAERILRAILQDFPYDTHTWYGLGCIYGDTRQKEQLDGVVKRLPACPDGELFAGVLLASWHLRQTDFEPAGSIIDELISKIPHAALPRLLRCQWLDLRRAPLEARLQACRDLLRVQPGNPEAVAALQVLENARSTVSASVRPTWCSSVVVSAGVPIEAGVA